MYSFTIIQALVGRSKAEVDMQCAYCFDDTHELGIKAEEDYFFIQGHRTYERISKGDDFEGRADELVPYIPWNLKENLRNSRINSRNFQEKIKQHRMCQKCYKKLFRFFLGDLRFPSTCNQRLTVVTKHTMRLYTSMPKRQYDCQCCGDVIPGGTLYGRRGQIDKICHSCFKLLEKYIGKEFSS